MPHRHRLLVLLIADMKVGIILLAQRTAKWLDALRCARGPPIAGNQWSRIQRCAVLLTGCIVVLATYSPTCRPSAVPTRVENR